MTRTTVVLGSVLLIVPSALLPTACSSVTCDETLTCASSDDGGPTSEGGSDTGVDGTAHDAAGDSSADSGDAHVSDSATESGVDCDSGAGLICGGQCVDPSSPAHCGSCTSVCPTTADGTATCAKDDGGAYACGQMCGTGYHQCGADCLPNSDDPSDTTDTCVVSESFGIFVSTATGADSTTCGTRAAPCKTIGNGITVAHAASGKRVYVCDDGTYAEQIALTAAVDGAAVYGGFSCTGGTWAYDATKKPLVMLASPTGAASCATCALTATGLTTGAKFEDMAFQAPNGVNPGDSSIAVFANGSTGMLTLLRSSVTAGNGVGWSTAAGTGSNYSAATMLDGAAPTVTGPGFGGTATCTDTTTSAGGTGGRDISASDNGTAGSSLPPATTSPGYDGLGGNGGGPNCTSFSDSGANGGGGGAGAASTGVGSLDANGWHPAAGGSGSNGKPGQGGGGGGGKTSTAPPVNGGGGGAGGCGGGAGAGGYGGGSSIAVLSLASSVSLGMCTLTTGTGGSGEAGGAGEIGQGGGAFATTGAYCQGNYGGNGGGGGGGGGGAGGVSVGIVYKTTAPTMTSLNFTPDALGAGGAAGSAGPAGMNADGNPGAAGAAGNAGPAGVAQQTLSLP